MPLTTPIPPSLTERDRTDAPSRSANASASTPASVSASASASGLNSDANPRPLRIVHVVLSLDLGGMERLVLELLRQGQTRGFQSAVLCLEHAGVLADAARSLGAEIVSLDKPPGFTPGLIQSIRRVFQRLRPDVIHTHQIGPLFYAGPAGFFSKRDPAPVLPAQTPSDATSTDDMPKPKSKLKPKPRRAQRLRPVVIHTEHGKHFADAPPKTRLLANIAARFADQYCCVSQDIASEIADHNIAPPRKILVVPNGIPPITPLAEHERVTLRTALNIPPTAPIIGSVGRLSQIKRQDILLRAFALLRARVPDAHFLLVGEGEERPALESLRHLLGLDDCVHLTGYQSAPESFLALMDIFSLSSDSEGMPVTVLEAWSLSRPVVATAVGGIPELITEGVTGCLVPPNDPASLADAWKSLFNDPACAQRLGLAGHARVTAEFSSARMSDRYENVYRRFLAAPSD